MSKVKNTLNEVGKLLKKALANELEGQGHRASASGSIIDGFKHKVNDTSVTITTDKEYANILETGIPKGSKVDKERIKEWVRKKGFATNETEVNQIAYLVARKMKLEGVPTKKAMTHSKNGRRIGFIDQVLKENEDKITKMIMDAFAFDIEVMFNKLPSEV
mgnify:FL=1